MSVAPGVVDLGDTSLPSVVDVAIDAIASTAATTVQYGSPQLSIIGPVIAGDILYTASIKQYFTKEYGGIDSALQDDYSRDIAAKTVIVTGLSFIVNQFLDGPVDILGAIVSSVVTFAAGNGIKEALSLE